MSRRITLLLSMVVILLIVGAGLAVYVLLPEQNEAALPAHAGTPAAIVTTAAGLPQEVPAVPEEAKPEAAPADNIPRDPFLGLPEDYDLSPAEFHRRRLASLTLARPDPGDGPVRLPGFRYVTLDRRLEMDFNRTLKERMVIYQELRAQKIPTAAPLTVLLHKVDTNLCGKENPESVWEPAVPVLPEVTSVRPPLVLKEFPDANVIVLRDRSMRFDPVKECKALQEYTEGRFGGTVIFRMRDQIPVGVKLTESVRADFILVLK
jgi:hypothetical protein